MYDNYFDKENYIKYMSELRAISRELRMVYTSSIYERGLRENEKREMIHKGKFFKLVVDYINNYFDGKKLSAATLPIEREYFKREEPNYFSKEKVAVYTCVFGQYDIPLDPISSPDNIDYYIITDQDVSRNSKWKKVDISFFEDVLKNLTNVEKNRWFKMHPFSIFSEYKYSVYVDGNVQIISDLTEFVNKIGPYGVSMFWHRYNNCVYQEALFNKYTVKKISSVEIDNQVRYLREQGMPQNFGMTTCNIIARDHENQTCRQMMEMWWHEFMEHCKRDQLSFPYVVWKTGCDMKNIATLGDDVWDTDSVLVRRHT